MSVRLEGDELAEIIGQGYGSRMGWPHGTQVQVTMTTELREGQPPRFYATVERKPAGAPAEGKPSP